MTAFTESVDEEAALAWLEAPGYAVRSLPSRSHADRQSEAVRQASTGRGAGTGGGPA